MEDVAILPIATCVEDIAPVNEMEVKIEAPLPERVGLKSEVCAGQREDLLRSGIDEIPELVRRQEGEIVGKQGLGRGVILIRVVGPDSTLSAEQVCRSARCEVAVVTMIQVQDDRCAGPRRIFDADATDRPSWLRLGRERRTRDPLISNARQQTHLAIQTIFRARLVKLA